MFFNQGLAGGEEAEVGIVGQTVLTTSIDGLLGRNIAGLSSWQVPSRSAETTMVTKSSKPMGVTFDGKDAIAIAYAETDKGNGTKKPKAGAAAKGGKK